MGAGIFMTFGVTLRKTLQVTFESLSSYFSRVRNLNTIFFIKLFERPRDIPPKISGYPAQKFGFLGLEGHTELFGPHPFTWKTPTPPEDIRTTKFRLILVLRSFGFRGAAFSHSLGPRGLQIGTDRSKQRGLKIRRKPERRLCPLS